MSDADKLVDALLESDDIDDIWRETVRATPSMESVRSEFFTALIDIHCAQPDTADWEWLEDRSKSFVEKFYHEILSDPKMAATIYTGVAYGWRSFNDFFDLGDIEREQADEMNAEASTDGEIPSDLPDEDDEGGLPGYMREAVMPGPEDAPDEPDISINDLKQHIKGPNFDDNPYFRRFFEAYLTAAFWSSIDEDGDALDDNYDASDLYPSSYSKLLSMAQEFYEQGEELFGDEYVQAGHDFWLSQNGHGTGFFDADQWDEETRDKLHELAKSFGEVYMSTGQAVDGGDTVYVFAE